MPDRSAAIAVPYQGMARFPPTHINSGPIGGEGGAEATPWVRSHVMAGNFPLELRKLLRSSGLSQACFAASIGVSRSSLTRYLGGAPVPLVVALAIDRQTLLAELRQLLATTPSSGRVSRPQLAGLRPELAQRPVRPPKVKSAKVTKAKSTKPARKRLRAKCYDPVMIAPTRAGRTRAMRLARLSIAWPRR